MRQFLHPTGVDLGISTQGLGENEIGLHVIIWQTVQHDESRGRTLGTVKSKGCGTISVTVLMGISLNDPAGKFTSFHDE